MDNFFGNKKQKAVWAVYVVLAATIFIGITTDYSCSVANKCGQLIPILFSLTLIFTVLSLLFKSSKKK